METFYSDTLSTEPVIYYFTGGNKLDRYLNFSWGKQSHCTVM